MNEIALILHSQNTLVKIVKLGRNFIEYDIIGISAPIANALRRISIAEVSLSLFPNFLGPYHGDRVSVCRK